MGLDMYLHARKYVSGWKSLNDDTSQWDHLVELYGMKDFVTEDSPSAYVEFTVAYWRKANAIHGWFVRNVQDGKDECLPHYVSEEQLKELHSICQDVLLTKERYGEKMAADRGMELLPPVKGFFFGVYDIGEWYWHGLERTVDQLAKVLSLPKPASYDDPMWPGWEFQYRSSW